MVKGDPLRISATSYLSYLRCPAQAEARFQRIFEPESPPTFRGALAHRLFARHLRNGDIEDVEQACREEIGVGLNHRLAALASKPSELRSMIAECNDLYQRFRLMTTAGFEAAEVLIEVAPAEDVTLVGRLDAVFTDEEGERIVDWKTGNLGEPLDQLLFYALLWTLDRRRVPQRMEAVSINTGETFEVRPVEPQLEVVAETVASMVNELRTAWADSRPVRLQGGPWCGRCPILENCPEGRSSVAVMGELSSSLED